jgi:signal transduction histidine kinase/CheY-like chemotaxis protein
MVQTPRSSDPKPLTGLYWSAVGITVLAGVLVGAAFWLAARAQTEEEWVRHTMLVRNQVTAVLTLVQRAESGQRGYLLTGRDTYLDPYRSAIAALPAALDATAALVVDNPQQQHAVGRLSQLIADKLRELRATIDAHKAGQVDTALGLVNTDEGARAMDEIRQLVSQIAAEEDRLLTLRQSSLTTAGLLLQIGAAIAFLLICVLGALTNYLTRRSFAALISVRDQLVTTNQELLEQASQRERAESQLRQAQKMEAIGQLTGGIAHDFNNMLGVIAGSLDLLQRRLNSGAGGIERFIEAAKTATERGAALTHRLLAFARQQPLAPEPVDINKMITGMSDLLRSTLGEHFQIEIVSAGGSWTTNADAHQLESAILNIAINARDAMPEGGKITIETANAYLDDTYCRQHPDVDPGQFVMVAISDTGTGMKPDVIARAFDPFFTTKPAGSGTGLGLSQVYGFVKQSRGHIKIYSELDSGTTVKIYLPRLIHGKPKQGKTAPPPAVRMGDSSEIILVVEDDPLVRRLTTEALRELGYTVFDSENARNARAILEREPEIKLLFTDVVMPDVNGKKLADEASQLRPDIKVLYTTGYTPNAVVHGGILDAGVHFLSKPFTLDQLAAKVRAVLDE